MSTKDKSGKKKPRKKKAVKRKKAGKEQDQERVESREQVDVSPNSLESQVADSDQVRTADPSLAPPNTESTDLGTQSIESETKEDTDNSSEETVVVSEPGEPDISIVSLPTEEDHAQSRLGQYIKSKLAYSTPVDLRKQLLPNEKHLNSKMVIYYSEGQIFLGIFFILLAFGLLIIFTSLLIFWIFVIIGVILILTGYASEELHITDFRILVRRMNWVDRFFRIPRDSQYILEEIVSFDIERAPMNLALLYSAALPWVLLLLPRLRNPVVFTIIILSSLILLILSQRLDKRTISFNMSGGHEVKLGIYKGIPADVVESFIDIVMEKNIFQSDLY